MTPLLAVYWKTHRAGLLGQEENEGRMQFAYDKEWLSKKNALPLSPHLPLRTGSFSHHAVRAFFSNLLPEGRLRSLLSKAQGLSEDNDLLLLEKTGGECAGALSIMPKNFCFPKEPSYTKSLILKQKEALEKNISA